MTIVQNVAQPLSTLTLAEAHCSLPSESSESLPAIRRLGEIKSLQAARGIAAILVVVCHCAAFIGEEPGLWQRTAIYTWLRGTAVGVQMFFVISGIVIFLAHKQDVGMPERTLSFCWKRLRRIYPLYWIFLTLTLLKHLHVLNVPYGRFVIASNYILIHLFSYQSIMVQGWTLFDEVQFYLMFAACIFHRQIGFAILGIWLSVSLLPLASSSYYWSTVFSPYHFLFGLGILVASALHTDTKIPAGPFFWSGSIVFLGAVIGAGPVHNSLLLRMLAGVGAAGILLGAAVHERQNGLRLPGWLNLLGDASYSIYLVHFMVISATARFAYAHLKQLPVPIGGWMLLLMVSGVSSGIGVHYAVERPLLRLMGKRT